MISSLFLAEFSFATECGVHFVPENEHPPTEVSQEVREISKIANTAIRKTYEVAQKIDEATLGLASGLLTGGIPVENIAPEQWSKLKFEGHLVFSDSLMGESPLRGTKMTFTDGSYSRTVLTNNSGEFSEAFTELVPTYRFRVFSRPNIERRYRHVGLVELPLRMKIETTYCTVETTLYEVPLEPFKIVISEKTASSSGF